jgi:hypothetical protein
VWLPSKLEMWSFAVGAFFPFLFSQVRIWSFLGGFPALAGQGESWEEIIAEQIEW